MGKFSAYKLPLKTLPHGSHAFDYKLQKQFFVDMESADIRDADLDVHVDVNYKGDLYEITLTVKGEITLICDRCLDDLQWPVDTTFHIFVKYGPDYKRRFRRTLEIPESDAELNIAYMILRHRSSYNTHQARASARKMQPRHEFVAEKAPRSRTYRVRRRR